MPIHYIIYARKSQDREDRQMASVVDQILIMKQLAQEEGLHVSEVISENISAKEAGRPGFTSLLEKLESGKAQGVICWKPNRLARNMTDEGRIIDLFSQNKIKHLRTYQRSYYPSDNVVMLAVEFGVANQFVKDLSVDVKRGLKSKVQRGWCPAVNLPIGYLHNPGYRLGEPEIICDPNAYDKMVELWQKLLTGGYFITDLYRYAVNELQLTTRKGKLISRSSFIRTFRSPFYTGSFTWNKQSFPGKHLPMITAEEFLRAQAILDGRRHLRNGNRSITRPYAKLIHCGECNSMITFESKIQATCTKCKRKFSAKHRTDCRYCGLPLSDMSNPKVLHVTYARCGKSRGPCSQKYLRIEELEQQLLKKAKAVSLSPASIAAIAVLHPELLLEEKSITYLEVMACGEYLLKNGTPLQKTRVAEYLGDNHTLLDKQHYCKPPEFFNEVKGLCKKLSTDQRFKRFAEELYRKEISGKTLVRRTELLAWRDSFRTFDWSYFYSDTDFHTENINRLTALVQ